MFVKKLLLPYWRSTILFKSKCSKKWILKVECSVASKILNEGISMNYLNNVRAVNGIVNENIFN